MAVVVVMWSSHMMVANCGDSHIVLYRGTWSPWLCQLIIRLTTQQRIKDAQLGISVDKPKIELPDFPSFIPFFPPLVDVSQPDVLSLQLQLKLGLTVTSYVDYRS